jgi:uncharacterized protein (TIRG00374 family)
VAIGFLASIAVFFAIGFLGGITQVASEIFRANLGYYALAFVCVFIGYMLGFIKWRYLLRVLNLKVPFLKNLGIYLSLYSMEMTPGRIGRVIVAYTLSKITKIRAVTILPIVTMDIFTDFLGFALLALIAGIYLDKYVIYIVIAIALLCLPWLFVMNDWFFNLLKKLLKNHRYIDSFSMYGKEYFRSYKTKMNKPRVYLLSIIFTLPASFFIALSLYFSLLAIGVLQPPVGASVLAFTGAQIAGMITGLPGSLGFTDGAMVALVGSIFGINQAASTAATIMTRIATLWFSIIVGGGALFYTLRYWYITPPNLKKKKNKK